MAQKNALICKRQSEDNSRIRKKLREEIGSSLQLSFVLLEFHTIYQVTLRRKYLGVIGLPVTGSMCQTKPKNYVDYVKYSEKNSTKNPQRAKYCAKLIATAKKIEHNAWISLIEEFINSLKKHYNDVYKCYFSEKFAQKVRKALIPCYIDYHLINTIRGEAFKILCRCVSKPFYKKSIEYFSQHCNNFPNHRQDLESLLHEPNGKKIIENLLIPLIYKQLIYCHKVYHEEPPFIQCPECGKVNLILKRRPGFKYCSDDCRTAGAWRARKIAGASAVSIRGKNASRE
jgi:endogenous inhibitor of DNA gyrase (YacG/DUF329 family)